MRNPCGLETLLLSVRAPLGSPSATSGTDTSPPSPILELPLDPWVFSPPVLGAEEPQRVLWCAVGPQERAKCDNWSAVSGGALWCTSEESVEDCIAAIAVRRALPPQLGSDSQTRGASADSSQISSHQLQG